MNYLTFWLVFSLVSITLALVFRVAHKEKAIRIPQIKIITFHFPVFLTRLMFFGAIICAILFVIGYRRSVERNLPIEASDISIFIGFFVLSLLTGYYFDKKKILLTELNIKKISMLGTQIFQYDKITKMIINYSSGNPAAAMTQVYCGGRKMILEGFLVEYENLIWELRYNRCKNATIVEKNK